MKAFLQKNYLKELLLGAVMLAIVLGPFQPLIAQAQGADITAPLTGGSTDSRLATDGSTAANSTSGSFNTATGAPTNTSSGSNTNTNQTPGTGAPACGLTSSWDLCITNVVYVFTVGIGSGFAYVAAYFFDLAVNLSLNGPAYALTFISTGWTTARDLANMAFLFILIYIAFTIILEADTHGTMSLLAGVIVIALLVNFSFFFTRVVIDAGNILSIQFYNSITAPSVQSSAQSSNVAAVTGAAASVVGASTQTKDLTASIMGMLQLQNLFNTTSFQNFYKPQDGSSPGFLVVVVTLSFLYIAAGIMFYLITVMFVTAGVKFLMRIVVLWFLIIASPLAFVARATPQFKKYFDQWREMLISHAFYPVAFMFIFLILTNFTNQMGNCSGITPGGTSSQSCLINDIFTSLPAGSGGNAFVMMGIAIANVAIRMGFVIGILYLGMKAADSVSVMGAKAAEKAGSGFGNMYSGLMKRGGRFASSATIGGAGLVGRNTFGAAGNSVSRSLVLRNAESKGGFTGVLARGARGLGSAVAGASFDARALTGKGAADVLGEAQKGGYTKEVKDAVHAKEERAKALEPTDGDKARAHAIIEAEAKAGKTERGREYNTHKTIHDASKKRGGEIDNEVTNLESRVGLDAAAKLENDAKIKALKIEKKAHIAIVNTRDKKMKALEKQVSGEGVKKQYADTLVRRRAGNLWGTFMRANREAADHIRHEKSAKDKFADAAKEFAKEQEKTDEAAEHATPAPAAAPVPVHTPAAPSAAPAHDTHAGDAHGTDH